MHCSRVGLVIGYSIKFWLTKKICTWNGREIEHISPLKYHGWIDTYKLFKGRNELKITLILYFSFWFFSAFFLLKLSFKHDLNN